MTLGRFTLCRVFDRLSFDPGSFDPGSFDPRSFDPGSFDPMSVNPINVKTAEPIGPDFFGNSKDHRFMDRQNNFFLSKMSTFIYF